MEESNIRLCCDVIVKGYFGDWKKGIKEASDLSTKLNIPIKLNYVNQYNFHIKPNMSEEEILNLQKTTLIIGL